MRIRQSGPVDVGSVAAPAAIATAKYAGETVGTPAKSAIVPITAPTIRMLPTIHWRGVVTSVIP